MQTHVKVLAVGMIVLSVFFLIAAFGLMAIFTIGAGVVGATGDRDAAIAIPLIGITGVTLVVFMLVLSLPGLITGFGLLRLRPWARILGIVLCAINLIHIPFGTLLGAYGLWVLLNGETERMFGASSSPLGA